MMTTLDAEEVHAWLAMMEPGAVCGQAGEPESCPLATYLKATYKTPDVVVTPEECTVRGVLYRLPDWAASFVDRVDEDSYLSVVTAQEALTILDRALRYPLGEDKGEIVMEDGNGTDE